MVYMGALDLTNSVQMYSLHYCYLPIIQRSLNRFTAAFNRHPLSSESGKSPEQLFVAGMLRHSNHPSTGVAYFLARSREDDIDELYGVDDDGPLPDLSRLTSEVVVDDPSCPIPDNLVAHINETINPLSLSDDDVSTTAYRALLELLNAHGFS